MLIEPETESAGVAGVGTFATSMRDTLLIASWENWNVRELPLKLAFASCAPSASTVVRFVENPRRETVLICASSWSPVMPGRNFRNSPTLPSAMSPKESVEITAFRLGAKRCSLVASASPSVSRDVATTNESSRTAAVSRP